MKTYKREESEFRGIVGHPFILAADLISSFEWLRDIVGAMILNKSCGRFKWHLLFAVGGPSHSWWFNEKRADIL